MYINNTNNGKNLITIYIMLFISIEKINPIVEAPNQPCHVINDDFQSHSLSTSNKQEIETDIALFLIIYVVH